VKEEKEKEKEAQERIRRRKKNVQLFFLVAPAREKTWL